MMVLVVMHNDEAHKRASEPTEHQGDWPRDEIITLATAASS